MLRRFMLSLKRFATSERGNATPYYYLLFESKIVEELKEMDKQEFESKQFVSFKDQFQWFLFVGLFLIILDVVVFERKTYWLDKLNLFNENE